MSYDFTGSLWSNNKEHFFNKKVFLPRKQEGPNCVATALAILCNELPEIFHDRINTQDPISWSEALYPWGMKLSYCPVDVRKISYYLEELIALDDLFLLCYYSPIGRRILKSPDDNGWICGSHIVVLHKNKILDPIKGDVVLASEHQCIEHHTKRLFRVVPKEHKRGL